MSEQKRAYNRKPKSVQHLQSIGIYDEWGTPNLELKKAMMNFDVLPFLDVCATHQNAKFQTYFTKKDNALNQEWDCNFFMNPPYSRITEFMEKCLCQVRKHDVTGLVLVYSKTDTRWWHKYVEGIAEVHFIKGRLRFVIDGVQSKNSAPYPSAWLIYRGEKK